MKKKIKEEYIEDEDYYFYEFERHIPPEEYPDWDGDESIMYEIENYVEEDEDELYCPICGSDDLENYGGSFECNDCGHRDNI